MRRSPHRTIKTGHLPVSGLDCVALAGKYGRPLCVTGEDRVVEPYESCKQAPGARYPEVQLLFTAEANGNRIALRRGEPTAGITAAMERPPWQK